MKWDVFISHASEDKVDVATPLTNILLQYGLTVWIDENVLKLGDSLRERIDHGLAHSRFGIVILSKAFFSKHWTQHELNGLMANESRYKKVILPLWHRVDEKFIRRYSPILADRVAIKTDQGVEQVALEVIRAVNPSLLQRNKAADVDKSLASENISNEAKPKSSKKMDRMLFALITLFLLSTNGFLFYYGNLRLQNIEHQINQSLGHQIKLLIENGRLEFKHQQWEKQLDVYLKISYVVGQIVAGHLRRDELKNAIDGFYSMYWGGLIYVKDDDVEQAMINFHFEIHDYLEGIGTQDKLKLRADSLIKTIQKSSKKA